MSNIVKKFSVFETLVNKSSVKQLKDVSTIIGNEDIGKRVDDSSFSNALSTTKKNILDYKIDTREDYDKEPFTVNQNRMPWLNRKKKKGKKK